MSKNNRHFFAGGNTARGFQHFYQSVQQGLDRVFVLTGGPGTGKSYLIQSIGDEMAARGYRLEWIHSPLHKSSLDGVLIPELNIGILDGAAPYQVAPIANGIIERFYPTEHVWQVEKLMRNKDKIISLNASVAQAKQQAYDTFAQALSIHDEWEKIYIANMSYEQANRVTQEVIGLFFGEKTQRKTARISHRFLGAATSEGAVDYIPNLTESIQKRYLIKGRPGSGKSTLLKKLVSAADQKGFDAEVYHCGFDPNSLDMVILPELSLAIFDSTAPHEYFPERESDEIIDMYERTIVPGTDEKYAADLAAIKARYSAKMAEATGCLARAKMYHDELLEMYGEVIDPAEVEAIKIGILREIDAIGQKRFAQ